MRERAYGDALMLERAMAVHRAVMLYDIDQHFRNVPENVELKHAVYEYYSVHGAFYSFRLFMLLLPYSTTNSCIVIIRYYLDQNVVLLSVFCLWCSLLYEFVLHTLLYPVK